MSNYYDRARAEFATIDAIRKSAKGFVGAIDTLHCALVGAILIALTGQCSALTTLFQDAGWIGPKIKGKDGKERVSIKPLGVTAHWYITTYLGLGRAGDLTPVLHFDRELGKWRMGGKESDPKWKAALSIRDESELLGLFETRFDLAADESPSVGKMPTMDISAGLEKLTARVRRAERKGFDIVAYDIDRVSEQVQNLLGLVDRIRADRATRFAAESETK